MPAFKTLILSGSTITADGIEELQKAWPALTIVAWDRREIQRADSETTVGLGSPTAQTAVTPATDTPAPFGRALRAAPDPAPFQGVDRLAPHGLAKSVRSSETH